MSKFLEELQKEFANIKFKNAVYYRVDGVLKLDCVFSRYLESSEKEKITEFLRGHIPSYIRKLKIDFKRSYLDEEIIRREIVKLLTKKYPMLSQKITAECIDAEVSGEMYSIFIFAESNVIKLCEKNYLTVVLHEHFKKEYIGSFTVTLKDTGEGGAITDLLAEALERRKELERKLKTEEKHTIPVHGRKPILGGVVDGDARYISELNSENENVVICGKVYRIEEKQTKAGKPMITFMIKDFTGEIPGMAFPSMNVDKFREVFTADCEVIIKGVTKLTEERGVRITANVINLCRLPTDFIPIKKVSKEAHEEYTAIFPKSIAMSEQVNLMDEKTKIRPIRLKGTRQVVFGVCTTGRDPSSSFVTKVSALSIENGGISEMFISFIDPKIPISSDITKMTGVEDFMLRGQPTMEVAIHDIYKFFCGATLIGYKGEAMIKFFQRFASQEGYIFDNEIIDIAEYAKSKALGLDNYKTVTVAEHLGVPLENPDRAVGDMVAMAQIFLKLAKL